MLQILSENWRIVEAIQIRNCTASSVRLAGCDDVGLYLCGGFSNEFGTSLALRGTPDEIRDFLRRNDCEDVLTRGAA